MNAVIKGLAFAKRLIDRVFRNMKKNLFVLVFIVVFAGLTVFSQSKDEIAKIRAEVNLINKNLKNYARTTKDVEGISLEGTEAKFYTSGKGLKKIEAKIYGESYNATAEIYYSGDTPIFIYQKFNKYDVPIGASSAPKIVSTEETRAYYVDKRIVRLLSGKNEVKPSNEKFEEMKKDFEDFSNKLFAAYLP